MNTHQTAALNCQDRDPGGGRGRRHFSLYFVRTFTTRLEPELEAGACKCQGAGPLIFKLSLGSLAHPSQATGPGAVCRST